MNGKEIIDYYLSDWTLREIADFLCDGEALLNEGFTDTDKDAVEEAYDLVCDLIQEDEKKK